MSPRYRKDDAVVGHLLLFVFAKEDQPRRLDGAHPRAKTSDIRRPVSFFGSTIRVWLVWLSGSRASHTVLSARKSMASGWCDISTTCGRVSPAPSSSKLEALLPFRSPSREVVCREQLVDTPVAGEIAQLAHHLEYGRLAATIGSGKQRQVIEAQVEVGEALVIVDVDALQHAELTVAEARNVPASAFRHVPCATHGVALAGSRCFVRSGEGHAGVCLRRGRNARMCAA